LEIALFVVGVLLFPVGVAWCVMMWLAWRDGLASRRLWDVCTLLGVVGTAIAVSVVIFF